VTWQKKSSAPATFSLKQAMAAMLSGDSTNGWLTDWMVWVPDQWFSTTDFCTAGPPPTPDGINLIDILSGLAAGKNTLNWALVAASIIPKLQALANDRVFGAYCEDAIPATTGLSACIPPDYTDPDWNIMFVPAGVVDVYVQNGDGGRVQNAYTWSGPHISGYSSVTGLGWGTIAPNIYIHNPDTSVDHYFGIRVNANRPP
jgi:hypothetical protein